MTDALYGWRVLELADGIAAAFCTKVLGDLGADVVKIEPPGGHPSRMWAPRREGAREDEPGGRFVYLNTGKASVVVDPHDATGLRSLVDDSDVVITDRSREELDAIGPWPAGVVVAVIRPFGSNGPYASFRAHHLVVFHAGGEGSILPSGPGWKQFPERPPIQIGGDVAEFDAGWNTAVAVLGACYDRLRTGRGERIDVSSQESQLTLNRTRLSRFNNDGVTLRREGSRYGITGAMRCRDGWAQVAGMRDEHWERLLASPEGADLVDPRFSTPAQRAADVVALGEAFAAWCLARPKDDVVRVLAPIGCPVGAYAHPSDLLESEQLAARGFFQEVGDGYGATLTVPGVPYRFSVSAVTVGAAPALGSSRAFRAPRETKPTLATGRGLEGIRVLDFTWAAAGPYATCLLALLGAEVVKVESSRRPDPARRGFLADYGGINRSPNFNELNLNKRSFQVDLSRPEGLELVRALVPHVDVVVDNFRPGVMDRFGLGAGALLAEHPGLIVASSSANGSSGPEALAAGLASIFSATGGLSEQTGYPDGPPTEIGESTDYRSANALAVAILAALLHRARTGEGQHIDLASREVIVASSPDGLLAHQLCPSWPLRVGNGHREMAPHDVFACVGEDDWIAIAIGGEDEWSALALLLGRGEWVAQFPNPEERRQARDLINEAILEWTMARSASEAFAVLQAHGVPASPVMTNAALTRDPHLVARGVFVEVHHPEIGTTRVMRAPWLYSDLPCAIVRPGPLIGQDNDYVMSEVLGASSETRTRLKDVLI
jgi:crotonobetainyl-CoA:carnitine CoA-transferase CaiB-like acyl-CoA transferase